MNVETESMKLLKPITFSLFLLVVLALNIFAQQTGSLGGQITDGLGGSVINATVKIIDPQGKEISFVTGKDGEFYFKNIAAGKYFLIISAAKFNPYENAEIEIKSAENLRLPISLTIAPIETQVEVTNDNEITTSSDSNASAIVLGEKDIENLPDDPEELEAYLQALAGGAVGMDGGEFYLDGFSSKKLPPKSSIREVRINRSPFSAENERPAFGGIEIFTKPGTDKYRGQGNFNFNDAKLNSRNPYALYRPPSQARVFGANFSGPIKPKKASFFVDFNNSQQDNSRIINASILDSSFNIVPLREDITVPSRNFSINGRADYQINKSNTLTARYGFSHNKADNQGVSDFSLPTRAFQISGISQDIRLTETMIINPLTVNETLFSYSLNERNQEGDNSTPTINVSGAFMGGGSQIGLNFTNTKRWELQNNTTTLFGKESQHTFRFGIKVRGVYVEDRSESNFGGMFTFAGVRDSKTGVLLYSSLEQFRQKVLGNTDPRFNPNQFSINAGEALSDISQTELGAYITDEWRALKNLSISYGLRFEDQTNIKDLDDFAPRFGFAYSPDSVKGKPASTVIRGGFGIFYSRLNENLFLQAKRYSGVQQTQYIVSSNAAILGQPQFTLNGVTNIPTIAQLSAFARQGTVTVRRISEKLGSPLAYQFAFSIDRQLPFKTKFSATYLFNQSYIQTGLRNINAPLCPPLQDCPSDSARPNPSDGNVYLYESFGKTNQQQLVVNFNSNFIKNFSLNGNYRYGVVRSISDGLGSFPFYSYDINSDYGFSPQDMRHNFTFFGSVPLPWKFRLSPSITASSGRPFNITSGVDSNRDSIFNDRPTYSQLFKTCEKLSLTNDFCSIDGIENPDKTIIPRNLGRGPAFFNINLSLNRNWTFKKEKGRAYNLTLGVQVNNLLNRTNRNAPIGNLSSNRFGQTFSTLNSFGGTANRRINLQVRFNF